MNVLLQVTGNTIFNVLRLGEMDCDADDRPLEPPRIINCEVLNNPFDDIVPRLWHLLVSEKNHLLRLCCLCH